MTGRDGAAEPTLFGPAPRRRSTAPGPAAPEGAQGPVATVVVDVPQPHLDHPFSYAVPARLAGQVQVGVRVVVPFAGRREDGWVVAVAPGPQQGLRPVSRVVTPQPVLTPEVAHLARLVADRWSGTLPDVLRSAVPPRHAAAEKALLAAGPTGASEGTGAPPDETPDEHGPDDRAGPSAAASAAAGAPAATPAEASTAGWDRLVGGPAFLERTRAGGAPRAAVRLPLDADPLACVAEAVRAALGSDRDAVVVLPDVSDVEACVAVLEADLGASVPVAVLHHGLGPARRWREFLRVRLGHARVVVGTRSAVFAPVARPGLLVVVEDGDDGHVEPHAPGWDSAGAALLRARACGAALAVVSVSRTVQAQWWVRTGQVKDVSPVREVRRRGAPRVVVPDPADPLEVHARVPRSAHRAVAEAVRQGPVLISVPRTGYATALQCRRCRHAARCRRCTGPLAVTEAAGPLVCRWCTRADAAWLCPACGGRGVRAGVVGVGRSAEELGRAFPGVPVTLSRGGQRAAPVDGRPRLVVATPGAEPPAAGGYHAGLVLDGDLALARRGLGVEEEVLRRWLAVASLVRPGEQGGRLVVVADPRHRVVQALVQDAPEQLADRLCDERAEVGLPPARSVARVLGHEGDVAAVAAAARGEGTLLDLPGEQAHGPSAATVLGPAPTEDPQRWQLLLTGEQATVHDAVRGLLVARSTAKAPGRLVVRVDPRDLD